MSRHDPHTGTREPVIRRLAAGDIGAARSAFAMMHEVFEAEPEALSDRYLADLLANDTFWALVAVDGDEPLGCLTAHELAMTRSEGIELFLYDLAVRADHQRRGIGRRLVETLVAQAAERGIDVVFVPADDEDDHALAFYESLGGRPAKVTMFDLGSG